MRLIDADAFKKVLSEHEMKHDKRRSFDDYDCGAANAYEHASDLLDDMPTVERPHGEWIAVDSYSAFGGSEEQWYAHGNPTAYHYCSVCKEQVSLDEFGEEMLTNFCPNCGADMREGDPDDRA